MYSALFNHDLSGSVHHNVSHTSDVAVLRIVIVQVAVPFAAVKLGHSILKRHDGNCVLVIATMNTLISVQLIIDSAYAC